ncbi:hypothetical protein, partial [Arthrobacter sp. SO3]|uniref:hypothetical protein n=1 Tax=Arthrobacter sp. SO3 TaxID=1897057 RepID=UPI001CFFAB72
AVSLGSGTGLSDGPAVAGTDGEEGAGTVGDAVGPADGGPADGGPAENTTASTTAAASNSTAAAAGSQRRRSEKIDHMLHCGTTGHSPTRAEVPSISQTSEATRGQIAPMTTPRMGAI